MSEHRRKPPQGRGRRAAEPPPSSGSGRRAASSQGASSDSYGGRAEARRAAQRGGGGRRRAANGAAAGGGSASGPAGHGGRAEARRAARRGGSRARGRAAQPGKKRRIDYPRAGKAGVRRWVPSWKLMLGSITGWVALMVVLFCIGLLWVGNPNVQDAATSQKNLYTYDNGSQLAVAGGGALNRKIVPYSEIPKGMRNAVISAENASFEQDWGVDPMGIARAMAKMAMGGETQSGSTITQQYVKNTYLDQSQTITRKLKELLISVKVGATESKDKILWGYLNTGYYGRGAYGIEAASEQYFHKHARELTPSQAAFLSATLNGPGLYDPAGGVGPGTKPAQNRKRAEARWAWTLKREVQVGRMSKSDYHHWLSKGFPKVHQPKKSTGLKGQKGYMVDLANNYLLAHQKSTGVTPQTLKRGGLTIRTTFNKGKVDHLKTAVENVRKKNLDPKHRNVDKYVQFGGASVKPGDGAIEALYGGEDYTKHFRNNADDTGVQVGSTFKPFVLASAMSTGIRNPDGPEKQPPSERTIVSPSSVYNGDNRIKLRKYDHSVWADDKTGKEWRQRNDGNEDKGRITLRDAMKYSVNTPYIQLGMDVGVDEVQKTALRAGLNKNSMARLTPTFSLGTSTPSAIRMANAYGTFANQGMATEPYSVISVKGSNKQAGVAVSWHHQKRTHNAFSRSVANNVTDVLTDVVKSGTGTAARALGRPAAGKTGTTDNNKSAWFTGYTPQLSTSIGMWRVNDKEKAQHFRTMHGVGGQTQIHGASFPAQIWTAYMRDALKGQKSVPFPAPEPLGHKIYGDGASPSPTKSSESPTASPTDESPSPTDSPSDTNSPSPTDTCDKPFGCADQGQDGGPGGDGGDGGDGGADGGQDGGDPGGGHGGIFGGPTGTARKDE